MTRERERERETYSKNVTQQHHGYPKAFAIFKLNTINKLWRLTVWPSESVTNQILYPLELDTKQMQCLTIASSLFLTTHTHHVKDFL